jgi:uncharacterized iron-regulated membrane protein
MHHLAAHDLFASLLRGFAWSVGWMLARGLGLPVAAAVLAVVGLVLWLRRRRRPGLAPWRKRSAREYRDWTKEG